MKEVDLLVLCHLVVQSRSLMLMVLFLGRLFILKSEVTNERNQVWSQTLS